MLISNFDLRLVNREVGLIELLLMLYVKINQSFLEEFSLQLLIYEVFQGQPNNATIN